jgi:aspartyl-tRNA(Asn)/glutamyl-tRNA(Gln) amidotransferase subunit C
MSLSLDDVKRIAHLARIRVNADEAEQTRNQLNGIFDLIAEMQAVDTTGVTPMAHARDVYQRLREDAVTEPDRRVAYQSVAPQTEAGLYLVPQVIE